MQSEATENFDDMWSEPNAQIDAFIALSRQKTLCAASGCLGARVSAGGPIWIPDVRVDENNYDSL